MSDKTYSSIKEALRSGIPEERSSLHQKQYRRASTGSTLSSSFSHATRSPDSRSSFSSSIEDTIVVDRIRLSASTPPPEEVDISELSTEDLRRLKEEDPFMYYSIPEVGGRGYRLEGRLDGVDGIEGEELAAIQGGVADDEEDWWQDEEGNVNGDGRPRRRRTWRRRLTAPLSLSCPAGMFATADVARSVARREMVIKRRRLSVEAHPNFLFEDLMGMTTAKEEGDGGEEGSNGEDDEDEEDRVLEMLMRSVSSFTGDEVEEGGED